MCHEVAITNGIFRMFQSLNPIILNGILHMMAIGLLRRSVGTAILKGKLWTNNNYKVSTIGGGKAKRYKEKILMLQRECIEIYLRIYGNIIYRWLNNQKSSMLPAVRESFSLRRKSWEWMYMALIYQAMQFHLPKSTSMERFLSKMARSFPLEQILLIMLPVLVVLNIFLIQKKASWKWHGFSKKIVVVVLSMCQISCFLGI